MTALELYQWLLNQIKTEAEAEGIVETSTTIETGKD
jgi:hypothetical protein